jgi:hypothetical protein
VKRFTAQEPSIFVGGFLGLWYKLVFRFHSCLRPGVTTTLADFGIIDDQNQGIKRRPGFPSVASAG